MIPLRHTIVRAPVTKKAHNRTFDIGPRCSRCRRGERTIVMPSEQFEDYEIAVVPGLRAWWATVQFDRVACTRCKATGIKSKKLCIGCGGDCHRPRPMDTPMLVEAIWYRERNLGDLAGFIQATGDVLETAGVIANDRLIAGWPMPSDGGMPLRKDAINPRVELVIHRLDSAQPELAL